MNDRDKEGKVNRDDFRKCLSNCNMKATNREVDTLINELDSTNTDQISYEEFLNCCYLSFIIIKECKLRSILGEIDQGKSGAIKINELREILKGADFRFPEDSLDRIFKAVVGIDL